MKSRMSRFENRALVEGEEQRPELAVERALEQQVSASRRVSVDPPWINVGAQIFDEGTRCAEEVDAEVLEEADGPGRQRRLDEVVGEFSSGTESL